MKQEFANGVGKNTSQTNIQNQKLVQRNAEVYFLEIKNIKKIQNEDVYNMEVDDNHNFAVNGGIIVHNCMDSTRYFVKTMKIAVPKKVHNKMLYF